MQIPLCDPKQEYLALKDEIDAAIQCVLEAGHYILGPQVEAFEVETAAFLGCQHAVGVNSGTDALHLALRALDIGPGDEVITTPFTFIATTEAIGMVGATPVFADIDPATFNIDPNCIEDAITPRTKAILPVHLYGQPCDMAAIMDIANRYGLEVVEDCAQAIGAAFRGQMVGTFGAAGCFSFFPSKNLGCCGDGGMVTTNRTDLYERLEMLRRHGGKVKYHHTELGLNTRLDEIQAAILRIKLPRLASRNGLRRQAAARYGRLLADAPQVVCPPAPDEASNAWGVYNQYTVMVPGRDAMLAAMREAGVGCAVYYPVPLHLQEVHAALPHGRDAFPHSIEAATHCLSLPMFPELRGDHAETVARVLRRVTAAREVAA